MARRRKSQSHLRRYLEWGGLLLLVLALVSALALFLPYFLLPLWNAGTRALFGWGAFLLPVLLGFLGLALVWRRFDAEYRFRWPMAGGWVLLFVVGLTALQMATAAPAASSAGGGALGYAMLLMLRQAVGPTGTLLVLLVATALGTGLALRATPGQIAEVARLLGRALWWSTRGAVHLGGRTASGSLLPWAQKDATAPAERRAAPPEPKPSVHIRKPEARRPAVPDHAPVPPPEDGRWHLPGEDVLDTPSHGDMPSEGDLQHTAAVIRETLGDFGIIAHVTEIRPGPTVTQFGIDPGFREKRDRYGALLRRERVKVSDITSLRDDLALALATQSLRIEAPVPGRNVIGIEVPNSTTSLVSLRTVMDTPGYQKMRTKSRLAIALGQSVSGEAVVADLSAMPHLLIAGSTGSGKSVCINAILTCLLMQATPDDLRLLLVDPKRVELTGYNDVPHLLRRVVVDSDRVVGVLAWLVHEMDERLKKFEITGSRNISEYNRRNQQKNQPPMPYIVLIIDELADLMALAADEVEKMLCRLAQLARATGIHLVVATQRPSVDVVTGLIKVNFPTRISFAMTTQVDSRTILDISGAEKLLGRGDMLFMPTDAARPIRIQGCFVSDKEIERVTRFWKAQGLAQYVEELEQAPSYADLQAEPKVDEMYAEAIALARKHRTISVSLLQRRLGVGYARAARLMDRLEEDGIVGPSQGGRSREVLVRDEDEEEAVAEEDAV
ncbi:MAG: DNA translocase FtsK [Bacteroidetes bacterium]|nr:DNA translocase FtsK [Bacteroidota bacterium]